MDRKIGNAIDVYGFAFTGNYVNFAAVYESQFAGVKQDRPYTDRIANHYLDRLIDG